MEDPAARASGETVIPLQEDGYAHRGAELVVLDDGYEPARLFEFVQDVNDAVTLLDLASCRVEEQVHAMQSSSVGRECAAQIIRHPSSNGSRPFDIERAVLIVELERRV